MHIFAISVNLPALTTERLSDAIAVVGREFRLDASTGWSARSRGGAILAAGMHHGQAAYPRRYVEHSDTEITFYDGLPVDPEGEHHAYEAATLARGWNTWADRLEGQFVAAKIDLSEEHVDVRPDTFGMVPVFLTRSGEGMLASTNLRLIQALLGLSEPDAVGVSALMGTGGLYDRTLLAGVAPLRGGSVHRLRAGAVEMRSIFGPSSLARRPRHGPITPELAERMTRLTASAACDIEPVQCPITAGRDSRVLIALLMASDTQARYYTAGRQGEVDVDVGRELATHFGLAHCIIEPGGVNNPIDGVQAAAHFMEQNEGLSTLLQLVDYVDLDQTPNQTGLKLWGAGGEIGRCGGLAIAVENVPIARHFPSLQRRALDRGFKRSGLDYLTPAGVAQLDTFIGRFFADRRQEGWPSYELTEALYAFAGPGWGQGGARRAAGSDDVFSPFRSRMFAEYCLALRPAERYVEAPHHRLLSHLSPALREFPYEHPFPTPKPRLASLRAARNIALLAQGQLGRATRVGTRGKAAGGGEWFLPEWIETNLDVLRQLFEPADSPLWDLIARERIIGLVQGTPADRRRSLASLMRAATIFWFFSGPRPHSDTTVRREICGS